MNISQDIRDELIAHIQESELNDEQKLEAIRLLSKDAFNEDDIRTLAALIQEEGGGDFAGAFLASPAYRALVEEEENIQAAALRKAELEERRQARIEEVRKNLGAMPQ